MESMAGPDTEAHVAGWSTCSGHKNAHITSMLRVQEGSFSGREWTQYGVEGSVINVCPFGCWFFFGFRWDSHRMFCFCFSPNFWVSYALYHGGMGLQAGHALL